MTVRALRTTLVGCHPLMRELDRAIGSLSRNSSTVLILGESGTGKELVARAIHDRSSRSAEPFVAINCGAFARGLLPDQLFGHLRGAFTGAGEDKEGVFQAAGEGTLFLDEIAEIDPDLQGQLLRAIQEREVVPLGSNRAVPWKARLIAATNRDLEDQVERKLFRQDLYYRINVVQVRIPPLRDRKEDIPHLAERFLADLAPAEGRQKRMSPEALEALLGYSYPGNVRELKNAIERAYALGLSPEAIVPADLPAEFQKSREESQEEGFKPLAQMEREHILRALRLAGGRKTLAAQFLQIHRNRLDRMMKRHRIG